MANNFNNNLYLESAGLQALIKKLAFVAAQNNEDHKTFTKGIGDLSEALTNLIDFLNATVVDTESEVGQPVYTGGVAKVIELANDLRAELGEAPEEITETVYEKLADLTERLVALEGKGLDKLIAEAFCDVTTPEYSAEAQTVTFSFLNRDGVTVKTAVIDTKDFVVHGLMDGVDVVSYNGTDENVTVGSGEGETVVTVPIEVKGNPGKYIVFRFKLAHEHEDSENTAHGEMKEVWVNVNDLFVDYDFEGTSTDDEYVTVTTERATPDYTAANKVTITVGLGDAQKKVNALVEGTWQAEGKLVGTNYRKYEDIDTALEAAETAVGDLRKELGVDPKETAAEGEAINTVYKRLNDHDTRITTAETTIGEQGEKINEIGDFLKTSGKIPTKFVEDYFDWAFSGQGPEPSLGGYNNDND